MEKILIYDKYDETYRDVIDVKELKEYILKRIEELKQEKSEYEDTPEWELFDYLEGQIEVLKSFLKDLEVEDD